MSNSVKVVIHSLQHAGRRWPWAGLLAVINLAGAIGLAIPVGRFVNRVNDHSLLAERLLNPGLDLVWLGQIAHQETLLKELGTHLLLVMVIAMPIYWGIHVYLTGGCIGLFREAGKKMAFHTFLDECRKNFLPIFMVSILSWIFYILIGGVFLYLRFGVLRTFAKTSVTPTPVNRMYLVLAVGTIVFFGLVNCFFDFQKVGIALTVTPNRLRQFGRNTRLFFRHIPTVLGTYGLLFIFQTTVVGCSTWLALSITQRGMFTILIVFLLHQAVVFLRSWVRLAFFAALSSCFHSALIDHDEQDPLSPHHFL